MRPRQPSFADPEGAFLNHSAIESAIDAALGGFPTIEQVEAADARVQRVLAVPDAVELRNDHLGVA